MKKLIPILLAVFAFAACEKDPDLNKLDNDYLVYTSYDKSADFSSATTYYLPDQILVVSDKEEKQYLQGEAAQEILNAIATNMNSRGYTQATDEESADLGIQISYVQSTYYFTDYGYPNWGWGNGGYWPGYWNNYWGGGYYYPYALTYSLTTNSFITEIVDLTAEKGATAKLPVWWTAYMVAPAYASTINGAMAVKGVNQEFAQSPYIKK